LAERYDAVVVGAGPNGMTAAALLGRAGLSVLVLEAAAELGGGTRTRELTLPGYRHDVCSAVHNMGCLSPAFELLELEKHGLTWVYPPASVAHPFVEGKAVVLEPSLDAMVEELGVDGPAYRALVAPFLERPRALIADLLAPLGVPREKLAMARFGLVGLRSARQLAFGRFRQEATRALLAGNAAHGVQPLENAVTAAFALIFLVTAHVKTWPVARGGSQAIARALETVCRAHGVEFQTGRRVQALRDLPSSRVVLLDVAPKQLAELARDQLPDSFRIELERYRMGPGWFKLDWALDGPIPWRDERCARASAVHVGGTFDEISASERAAFVGEHSERPFLILAQQSHFDDTRAPSGKHTGYAYCHVPAGSTRDMTEVIEAQVERFAPGFRQRILGRHALFPKDFEAMNPSYLGGAVTGGVADWRQLFTRPSLRLDPYSTPRAWLYLCSQSTPPGGGVHGMCGYYAARSALRTHFGKQLVLPIDA
jgi:phytoene dehydrogenase-like protein